MLIKSPGSRPDRVLVTFELPASLWAERICVVGDWNGWDARTHLMLRDNRNPDWHVSIELQAGRQYRFAYLVDGSLFCECQADGSAERENGQRVSVVEAILPSLAANPRRRALSGAESNER